MRFPELILLSVALAMDAFAVSVSQGLRSERFRAGVAAAMFEALYNAGINIRMISTSEIRITVLIDEEDAERAVKAAHDRFIDD